MFDIKPVQKKPDSELVAVFREIWEEREHVSQVSGAPLNYNFRPGMFFVFSHLHSRGSCPALRLSKENIWLMTIYEHELWEHGKEEIRRQIDEEKNHNYIEWKPCLDEYDRLKPQCNKISKFL